jgi:integrase
VAESVLDEREKSGVRGIRQERDRYRAHLSTAHFAAMPIDRIRPADITRWLRAMQDKSAKRGQGKNKTVTLDHKIERSTIQRVLTLASTIFEAAGPNDRELIESNPCLGIKVKKRPGKEATRDVEVFLTLEEQRAVRECPLISDHDRWLILFAFGSGVRMGEQHNVELRDVHVDGDEPHVIVRFGSNGKPRKNGLKLRVPLFGFALEATKKQVELLKGQANPFGLLFPTENGHRRKGKPLGNGHFVPVTNGGSHVIVKGKPKRVRSGGTHRYVDRLTEVLALAGITRHVRWHDLRHSCASSLLQGQWGDAWTIQEVSGQLGHSSITVTERYAHLGETALKRAAKKVTLSELN